MKKVFLIPFLLSLIAGAAQVKGFGFGPYVEAGWPTGNYEQSIKTGIGAGLGADIRLGRVGLTGSIGYMHFAAKTIITENEIVCGGPLNVLPIRAGFKYRLAPALYAKLESGVAKFTGNNESAIIFSPGIGLRLLGLDLQAKYEVWKNQETYSFLGVKAGFNF
jgi:hypothetical protein